MLIIFDLDDTLIDTGNNLTPIVLEKTLNAMIDNGLRVKDKRLALKKLLLIDKKSMSAKESIKIFLYVLKAEMIFYDMALSIMEQPLDDIKIFTLQNAKKILRYLSESHILAIVSKGDVNFQFEKIKKAGIDTSLFSKIVVTKFDNKGLYYKEIIDEFGYLAKDTIVCGDKILTDLAPAKKLGCFTIHMKWGRGAFLEKDENVDFTINNLDQMKTILDQKIR